VTDAASEAESGRVEGGSGGVYDASSIDDVASGGPGSCVPGGACGGVFHCQDQCYSDECCVIICDCTDPSGQSGNLTCGMYCP
jgi:hypothetical protein